MRVILFGTMTGLGKLAVFLGFFLLLILKVSAKGGSTQSSQHHGHAHSNPTNDHSGVRKDSVSHRKIFSVKFIRSGLVWQEEFKNKNSKNFSEISKQVERELNDLSSFKQNPEILAWNVSRLEPDPEKKKVIINLRVRTTPNISDDELMKIVSASNMNITDIAVKELHLATTSILPETSTSILATLSASVTPQMTSQTLDAPVAPTTSSMSTTARLTKTRFSLETALANSLISPSFFEMLVTSSEANVTEENPAADESTESVATERSPIKTQPTVPKDSVKFVVSMKVGSYNYTPEMENPESSVFKKVAREVENILYEELCVTENSLECIAVEVLKLAKGSVIISYNIHLTSSTKYKQSDVNHVITASANGGQLGRLKVSDVEVKQREKVEEDEEGDHSSSRVFVYVLCGVGALLVIAVIITAISKYWNRRKNQVHEIPSNNGNSSR